MNTQISIACNASKTRIASLGRRYQVSYFTNKWHTLPTLAIDREQAKRFADELKRSK